MRAKHKNPLIQQRRIPRIYAHRGSTLLAPENTLPAFQLALAYGADVLEIDVRISKDNKVIVTHDDSLERTTDGTGLVQTHTLAELKKVDAGYRSVNIHGETFFQRDIRLLTLNELFEEFPDTPINIDIKDNQRLAAELVANIINEHQRNHCLTVGSFHSDNLLYFRQIAPDVATAAVRREVARLYFSGLYRADQSSVRPYTAVQIPVSYKLIPLGTRRFIKKVQSHGTEICFWTINKTELMIQLLNLGADGIVTDRPDLASKVFHEMGLKQ